MIIRPRIVVFDTETTGLTKHPRAAVKKQPRIIEFGAAALDGEGRITDEINLLIDPGEPISPEITKITGIKNEDLRGAPSFEGAYNRIHDFFFGATWVVAHNLPFDKQLMVSALTRMRLTLNALPWPKNELCTVQEYRDEFGRNPKMLELYERKIGRPLNQTHRAIEDVRALVEIIQKERLCQYLN